MTDRELLELAANAAGIKHAGYSDCVQIDLRDPRDCEPGLKFIHSGVWNPLTDDGDALRLAVKLGLLNEHADFTYKLSEEYGHNRDDYAATRRAIVRAAAEIGRAKK